MNNKYIQEFTELHNNILNGQYDDFIVIKSKVESLKMAILNDTTYDSSKYIKNKRKVLKKIGNKYVINMHINTNTTFLTNAILELSSDKQNDKILKYFVMILQNEFINVNIYHPNAGSQMFGIIESRNICALLILLYTTDINLMPYHDKYKSLLIFSIFHKIFWPVKHILIAYSYHTKYDINVKDRHGWTALHYAVAYCNDNDFGIILDLIKYKADVNSTINNTTNHNLLDNAILYNNMMAFKYFEQLFKETNPSHIDIFKENINDHLCYICTYHTSCTNIDRIKILLNYGANIYYDDSYDSYYMPVLQMVLNHQHLCDILIHDKHSVDEHKIILLLHKLNDFICQNIRSLEIDHTKTIFTIGYIIDKYYNNIDTKYNLLYSCMSNSHTNTISKYFKHHDTVFYGIYKSIYGPKYNDVKLKAINFDTLNKNNILLLMIILYRKQKNYNMIIIIKILLENYMDLFHLQW